jgi:hypothetical protein
MSPRADVPDDAPICQELGSPESAHPAYRVRYSTPDGERDNLVVALAIAVDSIPLTDGPP